MAKTTKKPVSPRRGVPSRKLALELPIAQQPYWDREFTVNGALLSLERGTFKQAAQLVDANFRDDRFYGVLGTRTGGLLGTPIEFEPAKDTAHARKVADAAAEDWPHIFPDPDYGDLHEWGLLCNMGVGQLLWSDGGKRVLPRLQTWHPQWVWWDQSRLCYMLQAYGGLVELPRIVDEPHSDGQWVVYTPHGWRRWHKAMIRPLAKLLLMRGWSYRDYVRYCEARGNGIIKAKVPQRAAAAEKNGFFRDLQNIGNEPVIELPLDDLGKSSWDVEFIEPSANTYAGFEKFLSRIEDSIAVLLLGHANSAAGAGGVYGPKVAEGIKMDARRYDGGRISPVAQQQVLYWWAAENFGDGDLAPRPVYQTDPAMDDQAAAQAFLTFAQGLAQVRQSGAPIDVRKVIAKLGYPLLDEGATPQLPPAPAPSSPPAKPSEEKP